MKYFKFGFYSIVHKPMFNILIIIEIATILLVGNMAIAVANCREVLYIPYESFMQKDGYVFMPKQNPKLGTTGTYDEEHKIANFYDSLKGDINIMLTHISQAPFKNTYINISFYAPEIISKMNIPLLEGRWCCAERNGKGQIEAVVTQKESGPYLGDVLSTPAGDIIITGVIEQNTYCPSGRNLVGNTDVRGFYDIYDEDDSIEGGYGDLIASYAADKSFSDPRTITDSYAIITYNSEPSAEDRQYNEAELRSISQYFVTTSEFDKFTKEYLYEQFIKLMPILLCVFIIVLAELICSVAMSTHSQMKNYGIYFLCGCRWKDCLKISAAYSAIILVCGGVIGSSLFLLLQTTDYADLFEQNLGINNLYISLAMIAIMIIASLIIPFFMIRKTSPVETIKENAE